jgi:hypothetical protein
MVKVNERIEAIEKTANAAAKQTDVEALISNKSNVPKLFGKYVWVDASTGAVSLKDTAPSA